MPMYATFFLHGLDSSGKGTKGQWLTTIQALLLVEQHYV